MRGAGRDYQLAKVGETNMDIVAINDDGHVVALAYSDGGRDDRAFSRDYGRKFRIEYMLRSEACERHLEYLGTLPRRHSKE